MQQSLEQGGAPAGATAGQVCSQAELGERAWDSQFAAVPTPALIQHEDAMMPLLSPRRWTAAQRWWAPTRLPRGTTPTMWRRRCCSISCAATCPGGRTRGSCAGQRQQICRNPCSTPLRGGSPTSAPVCICSVHRLGRCANIITGEDSPLPRVKPFKVRCAAAVQ